MRLEIGRLAPRVLLVILAVEVALRFVPARYVALRGWEATRASFYGSFFLPNRHYENPRSFGGLSNTCNMPQWREYRHDVFTTDRLGYRNPPDLLDGKRPAAVVFGDSFAGGAANADDETISAVLGARLGAPVYNAAARANIDFDDWLVLFRDIGLEQGWVVYQHLPRSGRLTSRRRPWAARFITKFNNRAPETWTFIRWFWSQPVAISPLKIWLNRGLRSIEDGDILPNRHLQSVVQRRMPDGPPMLFLPDPPELPAETADADADSWRDLFAERAEQLSKKGLRLLVLLVPDKLTVYGPLLEPTTTTTETIVASYARMEEGLRARGVAVVNLAPIYRAEAKARLPKGETVFWRDDTHWNLTGIRIAAEAAARAMSERR